MAERLEVVWLDGTRGGGASSRGGGAPSSGGGGGSSTTSSRNSSAGARETSTRSTSREDGDSSSIFKDIASTLGFGFLIRSVDKVVDRFESLADAIDFFTGRAKGDSGAGVASGGGAGAAEIPPAREEGPAPSSAGVNPLSGKGGGDDFIEGEFTPKTSSGKSLIPSPNALTSPTLEGDVVGGSGALPTELAGAATAIEGELVPAAASAGVSLAGVAAVALPLTVALTAAMGAVYAFKMGLDQAYRDIEELEQFSGDLSSANAMGEVRAMMAEMRRADRLGPQLSELSDITSRGQEALYEVQTELMAAFLDYAEEMKPFIEAAITAAKITAAGIPAMKEQVDLMITLWSPMAAFLLGLQDPFTEAGEAIKAIKKFTQRAAEALEDEEPPPANDPFLEKFFRGAGLPPQPPQPPPPPPGGP